MPEPVLDARRAAARIVAAVPEGPPLRVPLDQALGSVLAEPVVSSINVPPWTNAGMDGYAARAADVRGASPAAPTRLTVVESIPAGGFPTRTIGPGECARIYTGAPVPGGADSVIRQEDTDQGASVVLIGNDRDCGMNLRAAGEDIRAGAVVFPAGTEVGPAHLGVLTSVAVSHPVVHRRPRVGILASGDEIVDLDQADLILAGRKIASSNSHTLRALVLRAGGEPVDLGIAADTKASLRQHLERARDCDLLITTAGVSVGEHDHLRAVIAELGGQIEFWRLPIRPGAPIGFGSLGMIPWIGLPGNPVSTMVTFELFARPAIRRMMGHRCPFRRAIEVTAADEIVLGPRLQHFLRAVLEPGRARPMARLTGPQGSGILTSMARANALVIVPQGQHHTPAGATLTAIRLDDSDAQADPPY